MSGFKDLVAGFHRFRERHFASDDTLYRQLVQEGQTPQVLVVACCDSRVDPALVFDCAPGDLFVIRNVANLVPPSESRSGGRHGTSAALEYGVRVLRVKHIVVLGHAHCGGIRALMSGQRTEDPDSFINSWMRLAEEARAGMERDLAGAPPEQRERACEQRAILGSLDNLKSFPWISERVEQGELMLHGWYFDMDNGQLLGYGEASGTFEPL